MPVRAPASAIATLKTCFACLMHLILLPRAPLLWCAAFTEAEAPVLAALPVAVTEKPIGPVAVTV